MNDIKTLKSICGGLAIVDSPSCGFGTAEIIFIDGEKRVSIYPACDGCDSMRYNSEKYFRIGSSDRKKLVRILSKYGAQFPCV